MNEASGIIKNIRNLKIQGAREIAKAGLRYLKQVARKSKAKTKEDFILELKKAADKLIKLRSTEPGLYHVLNQVLIKIQACENFKSIKKYFIQICNDCLRDMETALELIAKTGAQEIKDGDVILTHCHSHTVVAILNEAKRQGKKFEVIVTETRPLYQGILTARDLLKSGIKITYCVDSAIGYVMKGVTKVLVGCDCILPDGSIINKIGTFPIAVLAKKFGKSFMVAAGTIKFAEKIEIEQRDPKEIINPKKIPKAKIINPAFDITPAEFIDLIITEKGKLS
jgi:ribose 1,5-bisphosphate isomerase